MDKVLGVINVIVTHILFAIIVTAEITVLCCDGSFLFKCPIAIMCAVAYSCLKCIWHTREVKR